MSIKGPFDQLERDCKLLEYVQRKNAMSSIARRVADKVGELSRADWDAGIDPYGTPWMGNHGRVSLVKSGALRRSLDVDVSGANVALSIGPMAGGRALAVVHLRGALIVSRRWSFIRLSRSERDAVRSGAMAMPSISSRLDRVTSRGGRGMNYEVPGFGWRSSRFVKLRRNRMLPYRNKVPERWVEDLEKSINLRVDEIMSKG